MEKLVGDGERILAGGLAAEWMTSIFRKDSRMECELATQIFGKNANRGIAATI